MPKKAKELGPLDIKKMARPGGQTARAVAVGGVSGLHLNVLPSGAASWLLRVKVGEKRREIGLGAYPEITLAVAKDKARETRESIRQGVDPVEKRKDAKAKLIAAQRRSLTFAAAVERCLASKLEEFHNEKHRAQWRSTLTGLANPEIGAMMVSDITTQDVLRVLQPIWTEKTATASRLRGRIEAVLSWATVAGHRSGDNPARWAGNLKELLPAASKIGKAENQPAVKIDEAPSWFSLLRKRQGISVRALELAALCGSRSIEVRGARWEEIDLEKGIWTVPAVRMKMKREHRVVLSEQAIALLKALPRFQDNPLVFPSPTGKVMTDMALLEVMRGIHQSEVDAKRPGFVDRVSKRPAVPHGLRSTFRDWVAERTNYPGDLAEVALSHAIKDRSEAAYRRGDMVEKRRRMMGDWANFLEGKVAMDNVVQFAGAAD